MVKFPLIRILAPMLTAGESNRAEHAMPRLFLHALSAYRWLPTCFMSNPKTIRQPSARSSRTGARCLSSPHGAPPAPPTAPPTASLLLITPCAHLFWLSAWMTWQTLIETALTLFAVIFAWYLQVLSYPATADSQHANRQRSWLPF